MSLIDRDSSRVATPTGAPRGRFHPAIHDIWARRLGTAAAADRFLTAPLDGMPTPDELPSLDEAADRIERALSKGERIGVFGHDDADGITSAVVLAETLESLDGDVEEYIPDRHVEGHGLYPELIDRLHQRGIELLITTDGCSGNRDEVVRANALGMDVIVTDHHEVPASRPAAPLLVNPFIDPAFAERRGDLTGAGVAAILARELLERAERPELFPRLLDLVALGTIADWGHLGCSNREMVARGLADVITGRRPAVAAIVEALGFGPAEIFHPPSCRRLAAVLASVPSIDGKSAGFDALVGRPGWEERVDELVSAWRRSETEIAATVERAETEARAAGILDGAPAVLVLEGALHRGLGHAATRLVEHTGRPAALLLPRADDLVAELRGPEGVHLVEVLSDMSDLLSSWGGHRVAAGFSASLDLQTEIQGRLADAFDRVEPADPPPILPDATVDAIELGTEFIESHLAAGPFGKGNEAPVFRVRRPAGSREPVPCAGPDAEGEALAMSLQDSPGCAILFAGRLPGGGGGRDPLVTFRPHGDGSLEPRFVGWVDAESD